MKKIIILLILLLFVTYYYGKNEVLYRYGNAIKKDTIIKIDPLVNFNTLIENLDKAEVLNKRILNSMAKYHDNDTMRVGNYHLKKGMTYRQLLNTINLGYESPITITFNNIRTIDRLAGRVSNYLLADSVEVLETLSDTALISALGFNQATFAAMFIPNTYEVYWTETPFEFTTRMKQEYDTFWNEERREKAEKLGYTPIQISIIASIVQQETNFKAEMSDIAGVYINRLRKGMRLQADPTVKFAIGDFSIKRILYKHLYFKSPYNTYRVNGLPPGPICIPSVTVIDATLNYKAHKDYYFCAKADLSGQHSFASTLSQHNRNAREYQAELNRLKIK